MTVGSRLLAVVVAVILHTTSASADMAAILAEYWTDSGSLPPEYAWATKVTIYSTGGLILQRCTGYETEGPSCKTRKARIDATAVEAIRAAAIASGLAERPARPAEYPMVGGSVTGGSVRLGGTTVLLISDPQDSDAARVAAVLQAIRSAIPRRFNRLLKD